MAVTVSCKNTNKKYLKGNQRQWVEYVTCEKTEKCPLYADGKCACFRYLIGRNLTCPNGKWNRLEGYTSRSYEKFYKFQSLVEEKYKKTAEEFKEKLYVVADYVYVPLPFLDSWVSDTKVDGVVNDHFFKIEDFNEDLVEKLVTFVPKTIFYEPIKSYQNEDVPKFINQLKEEMPVIYGKWVRKYPETAQKYTDASNVGRTAYVSTLVDGSRIGDGWVINGDWLVKDKFDGYLFTGRFSSKNKLNVRVKIEDDMVAKVESDEQVDKNTKYVD